MKKIAILLQIGSFKVWNEIKNITDNFDKDIILMTHFNNDLISDEEIKLITKFYKEKKLNPIITSFENKGMDICGFFKQMEYIINNNIKIDILLKLHTKSDSNWRRQLMDPICKSKNEVKKCINYFESNQDIGIVCCERWYKKMDHFNTPIILNELKRFGIQNNYIDEIDWDEKNNNLYDLNYFDPEFYLNYPYNKIPLQEKFINEPEKLKSYALFHWLQIGYNKFRFVQNKNLVLSSNKHISFCAGTIFWMDANILINFFRKYIDFQFYYNNFEKGYFDNKLPTLTHSWERLFSIINEINKKKTIVL